MCTLCCSDVDSNDDDVSTDNEFEAGENGEDSDDSITELLINDSDLSDESNR